MNGWLRVGVWRACEADWGGLLTLVCWSNSCYSAKVSARVAMERASFWKRMSQRCAESHPGFDPFGWAWHETNKWDRASANKDELQARESDMEPIWQAVKFAETSDISSALGIWRDLAAKGSVWSMIEIGRCYEYGYGVEQDQAEAEIWYKQAFAGGSQLAMLKCAKAAASRGQLAACEEILKPGVDQDWTPAIFWLAWYRYKRSNNWATCRDILPQLQKAARRGHPAAQMILANFMVRGLFGWWRIPVGFYHIVRFSISYANRNDTKDANRQEAALARAQTSA